jgi:hypothetical protein
MSAVEIDQPLEARWQVAQVRPFVPKLWKNGFPWSIAPVVEKLSFSPFKSAIANGFANVAVEVGVSVIVAVFVGVEVRTGV